MSFNYDAAELLVSIFQSFGAGIANAISSFKWRKIEAYLYLSKIETIQIVLFNRLSIYHKTFDTLCDLDFIKPN